MAFSDEHLYSIALRRCHLIGDVNFRKLVTAYGSAESVWKENKKHLKKIAGMSLKSLSEIGRGDFISEAEKELEFCHRNNIKINLHHLEGPPYFLEDCADAPSVLFIKGTLPQNLHPLSIVGTRNITPYGKAFITRLLEKLSRSPYTTVSGLAYGVDTAVHRGSIEKKIPTIGVLAHGFRTLYPSKNISLAKSILENGGALVTEFSSHQKPEKENFIRRNRIVAGISRHLVVVETAKKGGSLSTVNFALGYEREVFALPGKITDPYSQGCNWLIYQNKAIALESVDTFLEDLGMGQSELFYDHPSPQSMEHLSEEQKKVYHLIKSHPKISLDEIALLSGLSSFVLLPILLELEIRQYIQSFPGKLFSTL
ncbi:MAG: DNA-protecting protein DprA [Bergeyella sp.]|nr:DNA-protecting protein DprA [Bergeyella sp.]